MRPVFCSSILSVLPTERFELTSCRALSASFATANTVITITIRVPEALLTTTTTLLLPFLAGPRAVIATITVVIATTANFTPTKVVRQSLQTFS